MAHAGIYPWIFAVTGEPFGTAFVEALKPHGGLCWFTRLDYRCGFAQGQAANSREFEPSVAQWLAGIKGRGLRGHRADCGLGGRMVHRASVFLFANRPRAGPGSCFLSCVRLDGGWFHVGLCLPFLVGIVLILKSAQLLWQCRQTHTLDRSTTMQWMLALLGVSMLARMALFARVYHFGFFQAAVAGMVIAAVMAGEIPRWTGTGRFGSAFSAICALLVLTLGCASIAAKSNAIRIEQTQPVGAEADRFYSFNREVNPIGPLVNWVVERLAKEPPGTLVVLPDGLSINFLTRRVSVMPEVGGGGRETSLVERLLQSPPDYVVLISLDTAEHGILHYGVPGGPGYELLRWVSQNYVPIASWGSRSPGQI